MKNEGQIVAIDRNSQIENMWTARESELGILSGHVELETTEEQNPLDVFAAEIMASPSYNPKGSKSRQNSDPRHFVKRGEAEKRSTFLQKKADAILFSQYADLELA